MTRWFLAPALLLISLPLGACGDAPASGDCQKLLSHFIALKVEAADESDRAKFTEALQTELGKGFLERCERNIKGSQIACGLQASSKAEFEACDS